jgi:hypothetical protein
MKTKHLITILGSITILYWATYIPSLYPVPFIDIQNNRSQTETVETNPCDDYDPDFDVLIKQENIKSWLTILVLIIGGIFSGLLILYRIKIGRFIAILFSLIVLIHMGWHYTGVVQFSLLLSVFKHLPWLVFRNEILSALICLTTIIFLSMPSVAKQFNKNKT